MTGFKPKTMKKIKVNKKNSITIDNKHNEIMNQFSKEEKDIIPSLIEEKEIYKRELLEKEKLNIEQRLDLNDKIKEINEKVREIKNKKKDYFLDNYKLIFYY